MHISDANKFIKTIYIYQVQGGCGKYSLLIWPPTHDFYCTWSGKIITADYKLSWLIHPTSC